jgi:anaerobic selenocysteine-containing dehydrogenase
MADIVLPATTFVEHDDVYQGGGHQHIVLGERVIDPLGEARNNHQVIAGLAKRLDAEHPGFDMTPLEHIDWMLKNSGWGDLGVLRQARWIDCQPSFERSHYLDGFNHPDGKYRFSPDWTALTPHGFGPDGAPDAMPGLPDHWNVIEEATEEMPFRMVTAPARNFLNSSFTETPTSIKREGRPTVMINGADADNLGVGDGDVVRLTNDRGTVLIHVDVTGKVKPGVVVVESVWPNHAFIEGIGINALTGADPGAPIGGAVFHDNRIRIEAAAA